MSRTAWLLMAQYQSPTIPLEKICDEFFGLSIHEANRAASLNKLPVQTYRVGSGQRAPRHVHIDDLAQLIDQRRESAARAWEKSQV